MQVVFKPQHLYIHDKREHFYQVMQRSINHAEWVYREKGQNIESFSAMLMYVTYEHIRTGIVTYWTDAKYQLTFGPGCKIYVMSTEWSFKTLALSRGGYMNGIFEIKQRGGWLSLALKESLWGRCI